MDQEEAMRNTRSKELKKCDDINNLKIIKFKEMMKKKNREIEKKYHD
jgi:hypothetical protein